MREKYRRSLAALFVLAWFFGLVGAVTPVVQAAQGGQAGMEMQQAVHSDTSRPLREVKASSPFAAGPHEKPLRLIQPNGTTPSNPDTAVQDTATGPAVSTTGLRSFDGVGVPNYQVNAAPPDTNGAAGLTQYVQWVNEAFAVFDKATGNIVYGPVNGNTLWQGFGGPCETNNDGDPIAQYDKAANRWVLTQFSVTGGPPYYQCVAISATSDATGAYYRYSFSYNQFNDYPKLGVWPDGYYITFNMFSGNSFAGAKVCSYDRAKMLTGAPASQICFQLGTSYGGLLPSDLDSATPPTAGTPNFVMSFGLNSLNFWKFHSDFATPANSTLTGPSSIPVASFSQACTTGACIPQAGTTQKLDALGDRLMYRLAYRKFSDHEALVVNHSVRVGTNKRNSSTGLRWYELRSPSTKPTLYQQGTYAPDATSRWMGSMAMDKAGNIGIGYSASSTSIFPGIRYTGRAATDPLGTLQAESIIQNGGGSQSGSQLDRWGDYSSMSIDPADDCTMWYTTEYLKTTGAFNWSTRIAAFKFPNCV